MVLNVLVHGGGAVGAVLGWRLAQREGVRVTICCRSNYEIVRRSGFFIESSSWGNGKFKPNYTVRHPSERPSSGKYDYVLVTTKLATGSSSIVQDLASAVSPGTTLCSAQNGISADNILSSAFPRNPILSAVCYISVHQHAPGLITQDRTVGLKPYAFGLGVHSGGQSASASLKRLVSMDSQFELVTEGTEKARWEKMIFNAAWNPSCALLGLDSMRMLRHPLGMTIVRALAEEAYTVARARGVNLSPSVVDRTVGWAAENPLSEMVPSMLRDVQARKPVEVEGLCGALVKAAKELGIAVPTISAMDRILTAKNQALLEASLQETTPHHHIAPAIPQQDTTVFGNAQLPKQPAWSHLMERMPSVLPLVS